MSATDPTLTDAHVSDAQRCITKGLPVAASTVRGLLARLATDEAEKEALRVEVERLRTGFAKLGFCPKDFEPMPCFTCGAGL